MATKHLALYGGTPVRTDTFPSWPVFGDEEEDAVLRVVRSGQWGCLEGGETTRFEQEFAAYIGTRHGIAVFNGSVALRLALLALDIQGGDEVIVPPYTFLATATAVVEANAAPVFVDIAPDSYCLDPDRIEAAITERTRAIIPVHLGGQAADMDRIREIAARHDLAVIEDAAHAHGGEYKGRKLGSLGGLATFSFQSSKNLNSGEGGIILTNEDRLAERCRSLHNCGRVAGGVWYEHPVLGGNYRLTEFQSAILSAQLSRLDAQTRTRDANGLYLNRRLSAIPGIRPLPRGQGETRHGYHLYLFRYEEEAFGVPRDIFLEALSAEGIPASAGYPVPLYAQPVFAQRNFGPYTGAMTYRADVGAWQDACPVTERACRSEACWLGQSLLLGKEADMDDIADAVAKVYEHRDELRERAAP